MGVYGTNRPTIQPEFVSLVDRKYVVFFALATAVLGKPFSKDVVSLVEG